MPRIKISDTTGFVIETQPGLTKAIQKYFKNPLDLILGREDIKFEGSLKDFPLSSLRVGLTVEHPVEIGVDDTDMTLGTGLSSGFAVFREPGESPLAEHFGKADITVEGGEAYLSFDVTPTLSAGVSSTPGDLSFGFDAGAEVRIANLKPFAVTNSEPSLAQALQDTLNGFSLPGDLDDLEALERGRIIAVNGAGTLKFSAGLDVTVAPNALATLDIPELLDQTPLKPIVVKAGASLGVSTSYALSAEFQLRVRKLEGNRVELGYYKLRGSEGTFEISAHAGVAVESGEFDLTSAVLKAVSGEPRVNIKELEDTGLGGDQIAAITNAIEAGVNRNLELSLAGEFSALKAGSAAFLYEVDLDKLDDAGREAVHQALDGDLTKLVAREQDLPTGVEAKQTIVRDLRAKKSTLKVNLFGIFNFISVSKLIVEGTVFYDHEKGELIITDKVTAERIAASLSNFAADSEKVRRVQMESFLFTAAYRGSRLAAGAPLLESTHSYFELHARTNRQTMKDNLDAAEALLLLTAEEKQELLGDGNDFGRSTLYAETGYDDDLIASLFLDSAGKARPREDYEQAGREALKLLYQSSDPDSYRQRPALDDGLWEKMKAAGSFSAVAALLPDLNTVQQNVVHSDYLVVQWWADAMRAVAEKIAEVRDFLELNGDLHSMKFKKLRKQFRKKITATAKTTKKQFGDPWGLVAMDVVAGRKARAEVKFTGEVVAYEKSRSS